jgi:hypothetical protein
MTDIGKQIYFAGAAMTITIPSNGAVAFPIGTSIMLINAGTLPMTVVITPNDTLTFVGTTLTGTRTLSGGTTPSMATIVKVTATRWIIWGEGVT